MKRTLIVSHIVRTLAHPELVPLLCVSVCVFCVSVIWHGMCRPAGSSSRQHSRQLLARSARHDTKRALWLLTRHVSASQLAGLTQAPWGGGGEKKMSRLTRKQEKRLDAGGGVCCAASAAESGGGWKGEPASARAHIPLLRQ